MNSQNFETPDFLATDTRGCCNQRQCDDCETLFNSLACANNFGIFCAPNNAPQVCTCHDICVEEVRLIGAAGNNQTCEFTQCFNFPPIGPCRLGSGITLPTIDVNATLRVFVVCAQERLNTENCAQIIADIRVLILAPTLTPAGLPGGSPLLLPLDLTAKFTDFFRFPECTGPLTAAQLQNELTQIDGSCLVIQLKADAVALGGGVTQIIVSGKVIDKLWKNENLWVQGIRPYGLSPEQIADGFVSFTIHDIFNNQHQIGACGPLICPT